MLNLVHDGVVVDDGEVGPDYVLKILVGAPHIAVLELRWGPRGSMEMDEEGRVI